MGGSGPPLDDTAPRAVFGRAQNAGTLGSEPAPTPRRPKAADDSSEVTNDRPLSGRAESTKNGMVGSLAVRQLSAIPSKELPVRLRPNAEPEIIPEGDRNSKGSCMISTALKPPVGYRPPAFRKLCMSGSEMTALIGTRMTQSYGPSWHTRRRCGASAASLQVETSSIKGFGLANCWRSVWSATVMQVPLTLTP